MTQEEKQLLLQDLCTRLPYRVMIKSVGENKIVGLWDLKDVDNLPLPYLRPMSSMTEEERMEFTKLFDKWHDDELFDYIEEGAEFSIWKHKGISPVVFDWLNAHHFDYRGLIHMGIAIEAPNDMYNTKIK